MALNSGTSALHLALLALGIGPGDEVITPAMTFVATVAAIRYAGATPVLVDVDPLTWTIDPAAHRARDHAAHQGDHAGPPARPHGRHGRHHGDRRAHGLAGHRGRRPGAWRRPGRAGRGHDRRRSAASASTRARTSAPAAKAAAVVTNDPALAARMRKLRDWGQEGRYNHVEHAFNYRMDGIQGAILSVKLAHLPRWTERRREVAALYDTLLAGLPVQLPAKPKALEHVYHVYARAPSGPRPARARPRGSRRRDGPPLSAPGASAAGLCRSRQRPRQLPGGRGPRRRVPLACRSSPSSPPSSSATSAGALRDLLAPASVTSHAA